MVLDDSSAIVAVRVMCNSSVMETASVQREKKGERTRSGLDRLELLLSYRWLYSPPYRSPPHRHVLVTPRRKRARSNLLQVSVVNFQSNLRQTELAHEELASCNDHTCVTVS